MFGDLTNELVTMCMEEVNTPENQEKIQQNIVDPIIRYILHKIQPYLIATALVFVFLIVLLIVIIVVVSRK